MAGTERLDNTGLVTPREFTLALAETNGGIRLADERKKLASGRLSLFYINLGDLVVSYPHVKNLATRAAVQTYLETGVNVDRVIGVPEGMNMLASSIGDLMGVGQLRVREQMSDHGDQRSIEGNFEEGMRVGVFEDVMSTGGSTEKRSINPLRAVGLKPEVVIALVDREYGGIPAMRRLGLTVAAFTNTTQMAEILIAEGGLPDNKIRLLQEELAELKEFRESQLS